MTTRHVLARTFGALCITGVVLTAGCESLGFGGDKERDLDRDRASDRRQERERAPERQGDSDTDRGVSRRGDADGVASLPQDARKVRDVGAGERIRFKADGDGRVFAVDVSENRVVYAGAVRRDDQLVLNPSIGRAELNGRPITMADPLSKTHGHALYFLND